MNPFNEVVVLGKASEETLGGVEMQTVDNDIFNNTRTRK